MIKLILGYLIIFSAFAAIGQQAGIQHKKPDQPSSESTKMSTAESLSMDNFSGIVQVNNNIQNHYELSNWGFGTYIFLGYGIFTENLNNSFNNYFQYGIGANIEYKKWLTLYAGANMGVSKAKNDFTYDDAVLSNGSKIGIGILEATVGHAFLDKKFLKFVPFVGIASISIARKREDGFANTKPDPTKRFYIDKVSPLLGINLDFKTFKSKQPETSPHGKSGIYDTSLRLKYAYYFPQFEKKYDAFGGNIHSLTLGISGIFRKKK